MNLSKFAVKRPVTIAMIILMVVLFGTISLAGLPIDLFPEIEMPVAIVMTTYQGAGPQEIETLITERIEESVATVSNIDQVHSISSEGSSIVIAQFNFKTDMDFAALEMREKVDLVKTFLPEDASDPMVMRVDPNATPIMQIAVSNVHGDLAGLQTLAEDEFQPAFERLEGVASVDIGGGLIDEIKINVDPWKLSKYNLSVSQLTQLIAANNTNMPGGNVDNSGQELSIRIVGEFDEVDEIKNLPITLNSGAVIALQDVAEVTFGTKDSDAVSRVDGIDSINISIQKQSDSNTVQVAEKINKEIEKLRDDHSQLDIKVILDSSEFITLAIDNVIDNVLSGSVFAIIILYIFLKNFTSTLIVSLSIPISLIASFILLYFSNITLNMMTLGGLALAVGMLVDSAIVVLENIYRYRASGLDKEEASIRGAGEVAMSITASTLTTIAVFLPIVFIDGFIGIMFKDFALTVTLSLIASMVVALTLIPMMSSKFLAVEGKEDQDKKKLAPLYNAFDKVLEKIERFYIRILNRGLSHRKTVVFIAIIFLVSSIASFFFVGMELMPSSDEGLIYVNMELPLGSKTKQVNEISLLIEEQIKDVEEVDILFTNIGMASMTDSSTNIGSVSINLVDLANRDRSDEEIADEIRELVKDIPGAEIRVQASSSTGGMVGGSPVSIKLKGDDLQVLEDISMDIKSIVDSVEGTRDSEASLADAIPELEVRVKKDQAASYGLTTAQIASSVRTEVAGSTVTQFKSQGDEIDVVISAFEDLTKDLTDLENLNITTPTGLNIPLSQVADITIVDGPISIQREDQERLVTVSSEISERDLGSIMEDIDSKLEDYEMPDGYYYDMGGENEEMMTAFGQLASALLVAVVLIYMIMAAQFESLLHPFIIMFTIPLAFGGGILALFITRTTFSATAFIGIIMLAGIIVNNGIVLVDYINLLQQEGHGTMEAIKLAGPVRLRPILMTTLTTILGLVPLALGIGEGAELQAPMAIVVIGGLTMGTILTLVFVPVLYSIFEDLSSKFKNRKNKRKKLNNKEELDD